MNKLYHAMLTIFFLFLSMGPHTNFVHCVTLAFSCDQTPYPETCNYFIDTQYVVENQMMSFSSLRDQSLLVTMSRAVEAHKMISSMDVSSFDQKAKMAWLDCLDLYGDSIEQINSSIIASKVNIDLVDSQTWLSATFANLQTCQNGFVDFGLSSQILDKFLPTNFLSNFTKLLSNSLALIKSTSKLTLANGVQNRKLLLLDHGKSHGHDGDHQGFPSWVSGSDRKLLQTNSSSGGDIVVAQDGSGNCRTIQEALSASIKQRSGSTERFVIYVKKGIYIENLEIKKSMKNLMLIGDGIDVTIITGGKNVQDGSTTFRSATVGVTCEGFIAKDITFENTAGAAKHQAVALRSGSDFSVFYRCSFKGHQDTLYVYSQRQFYRECDIYGTIDFIFGDAVVVLQSCNIFVRTPLSNQKNTLTAQGRTDPNENTGIVVHTSTVLPAKGFSGNVKTFLGRPWQKYSRTVFMKTELDKIIDPLGWLPWSGNFGLSTLYYGEYMNTGSGASTSGRVNWPGYHVITSATEAGKFTVGNFLAGGSWISPTGVPFQSGL